MVATLTLLYNLVLNYDTGGRHLMMSGANQEYFGGGAHHVTAILPINILGSVTALLKVLMYATVVLESINKCINVTSIYFLGFFFIAFVS